MSAEARCSFCGKRRDQIAWLVAGQREVFICDEYVVLAAHNFDPPSGDQGPAASRIMQTRRPPSHQS